jgi:TolB-like protein/DNA-binding winged helix-turn-helix (wHTH) protein/tetratricopeptide (TPR) repeat protein
MTDGKGDDMPESYRFGGFEVNIAEHTLKQSGHIINLRPKAFQTLAFLLARHGRLVKKDELLASLWPGVIVTESALSHCIEEIRTALGDDPHHPVFLQTMPRVGFRFIADVVEVGAPHHSGKLTKEGQDTLEPVPHPGTAAATTPAPAKRSGTIPTLWREHSGKILIAMALLLAVVLTLVFLFWPRPDTQGPISSLAVLPFENLSGDADEEYFADGLTDALISEIARFGGLRIISRTSAMQYKHARKTLSEIARELHVDAVIEGSVIHSREGMRVTAALVAAGAEHHLWSATYERDRGDLAAIVRVMARTIASEIHLELRESDQNHPNSLRAVDPAVYEMYLKGRYFWNKRTPEGFNRGIEYFDQALAVDPDYAPAYAGLADCFNMLGDYDALPPMTAYPKAKAAALQALAIDNTLSDAHASLAFAAMHSDWSWPDVEREFQLAISMNPNGSNALHWYALYLTSQGRFTEAQETMKEALALDPLSLIVKTNSAWVLYFAGDYETAVSLCRDALQLDSNFMSAHIKLGWTYERMARYREARNEFEKAISLSGNDPAVLLMLARVHALKGDRREALSLIKKATEGGENRYVPCYHVAAAYTGLGEKDTAMLWLNRAYRERNGWLSWLNVDPKFAGLRGYPGFSSLLDSLGFGAGDGRDQNAR